MKKRLVLVMLAVACALCLVACGSGNNGGSSDESLNTETREGIDKNDTASYVGKWKYDTGKGNVITFTFDKGDTGRYEQSTKEGTTWDFTYEAKEEVVVCTRNASGTTFLATYELSDDGQTLVYVSGDMPKGEYSRID